MSKEFESGLMRMIQTAYRVMQVKYLSTIAFLICLVAIEYLATTTMQIKPLENTWDKAKHFTAFLVLFLLLIHPHLNFSVFTAVLLLLLFGVQVEVVQYFIPGREFSGLDVLADAVGILMGIFVMKMFGKIKNIQVKPEDDELFGCGAKTTRPDVNYSFTVHKEKAV